MSNRNLWIFGIIIFSLIFFYIIIPVEESFSQIMRPVHAKIGGDGQVLYYSLQPPAQNGEFGCASVPCPEYIKGNVTCWCCCNYN